MLPVEGDIPPRVRASGVAPRVSGPRVISVVAGARDRVKRPDERSRDHVVRAHVARRRAISFAGVRSDDEQVLEDARRTLVRAAKAARTTGPHVDETIAAERGNQLPGIRVDLSKT